MTDKEDEEISKETLISLLKDKSKEIKTLTTKLQKLEEKYVKNYKEAKLYKKDFESLTKFIKQDVFDKEPYSLQSLNMGEYDYDKIHELWIKRESHSNQTLTNMFQELNQEKQEAQKQYEKMFAEAQKNAKSLNQNNNFSETIKKYENQLYDLNEQNQRLADQIVECNQIIQQKIDIITQLKKVEEQYQQQKAEMLLKELQSYSRLTNEKSINSKMLNAQKLNDHLKVKNELEISLEKNRIIESQIEEMNSEIQKLRNQLNAPKQPSKPIEIAVIKKVVVKSVLVQTDIDNDSQLQHLDNSAKNQEQKNNETQNNIESNNESSLANCTQSCVDVFEQNKNGEIKDTINHEYLKNVILKYFIYQEGKYYNEASLLMSAIMTILKMSKEDREKVYIARYNASLWNSTKSFISNTFTFGGGQQEFDYLKK